MASLVQEMRGAEESLQFLKGGGLHSRTLKDTNDNMQIFKIPEAVVAFAQAAAKTNDLAGWPLLTPSKMLLQKCGKCSREFCSSVNYRRHIRIHRRSLVVDKAYPKNREIIGAFWDKLSSDEAKEITSFKNAKIEDVTGSSILTALNTWLRKPGFFSLPQAYVKAGTTILDVIQGRSSRFPVSSQELFCLLDDASEGTFLCTGMSFSLQKFIFDGEVGRITLDMKNLIACISFLLEQQLVKAWIFNKDEEALRCQKLLVEEEEAAQKRQAVLLERKRLKKLKQKEHKAKDHNQAKDDLREDSADTVDDSPSSTEVQSPKAIPYVELDGVPSPYSSVQALSPELDVDVRCASPSGEGDHGYNDETQQEDCQRQGPLNEKSNSDPPVLQYGHNRATEPVVLRRYCNNRDTRTSSLADGKKFWIRKAQTGGKEETPAKNREESEEEMKERSAEACSSAVVIGDITVSLTHCDNHVGQKGLVMKSNKSDPFLNDATNIAIKKWRPVASQGVIYSSTAQISQEESKIDAYLCKIKDYTPLGQSSQPDSGIASCKRIENCATMLGSIDWSLPQLFSRLVAEEFLSLRWKETLASDHVTLDLPCDT